MKNPKKQTAFSLIELILYIALFCLVLIFILTFLQQVVFMKYKIAAKISLANEGQFVMQKINYYLRQADTLHLPDIGQVNEAFSFNIDGIDYHILIKDEHLVVLKANEEFNLTSSRITVNSFNIYNYSFNDDHDLIKIELNLSNTNQLFSQSSLDLSSSYYLN